MKQHETRLFVCFFAVVILALVLPTHQLEEIFPTPTCNGTEVITNETSQEELLQYLTDSCRYDRLKRPPSIGPIVVSARVFIYYLKASKTSGSSLTFTAQVLLQLRWDDDRLKFNNYNVSFSAIFGEKYFMDSIWMPHVFLNNEKDSLVMGFLRKDDFVVMHSSGHVRFTTRLKSKVACHMELGKFPFDVQSCSLIIDSWRYNSSALTMEWEEPTPVQLQGGKINLTEFTLLNMSSNTRIDQHISSIDLNKYNYSSLVLTFVLAREYGYYIMDYYIPSVLIVILSWVSFWLAPDALPARINLGSSTMLTFLQLGWAGMPKSPSNNIWAITCTLFIFLSLVEFAFVNTIDRAGDHDIELKKPTSKYILKSTLSTPKQTPRVRVRRPSSCPSSPEMKRHFAAQLNKPRHKIIQQLSESEFREALQSRLAETVKTQEVNETKNEETKEWRRRPGVTSGILRQRKVSKAPHSPPRMLAPTPELSELEQVKRQLRRDSLVLSGEVKLDVRQLVQDSEKSEAPAKEKTPHEVKAHRRQSILHQVPVFTMTNKEIARWIDQKSQVIFPLSFIVFCVFYWTFLFV